MGVVYKAYDPDIKQFVAIKTINKELLNLGEKESHMLERFKNEAIAGRPLGYAHEHGVVHRDIKPPTSWLWEEGQIQVTDFRIAKIDTSSAVAAMRQGRRVSHPPPKASLHWPTFLSYSHGVDLDKSMPAPPCLTKRRVSGSHAKASIS